MLELRLITNVASRLIGTIASVERVQGFVGNECFRLSTEDGETFYLKSGTTEAIRAEAWACEQARQVDVLAPTILTAELQPTELPNAYLIEHAVPGKPISVKDEAVVVAVGEQLRRLHSIKGTGYGFLHEELCGTWTEVIRQPFERLDQLTAAGVMPPDVAERLNSLKPFEQPVEPALLHADLHPRHIYAADEELTGIIDWGDAAFGDPLFDLGRFSRAGTAPTKALLNGYGIKHTPELERTLTFYRVTWSLLALHWELKANGDWFASHIDAIRSDLPQLQAD